LSAQTGWHWVSGNTAITWVPGEPSNNGDYGQLQGAATPGSSRVDDTTTSGLARIVEYENAMFVRKGDAAFIDLMTGSAVNDIMAGLGGRRRVIRHGR
jgi:hypothetical protein